jgi:hypothetical protein
LREQVAFFISPLYSREMPASPPELPTRSQAPLTIPQLFEALCGRDQERETELRIRDEKSEQRHARVELDVLEVKKLLIEKVQTIEANQRELRTDVDGLKSAAFAAKTIEVRWPSLPDFVSLTKLFQSAVLALWALTIILFAHEALALIVK